MKVKYTAEFLLDKGIKINEEGGWLLHYSAFIEERKTEEFFLKLIRSFANDTLVINLEDNSGRTALHYAAMYGNQTIVDALLPYMSAEAISLTDIDNNTALDYAYENRHQDIFDRLLPVTQNSANLYPLGYDYYLIEPTDIDYDTDESLDSDITVSEDSASDTSTTGENSVLPE